MGCGRGALGACGTFAQILVFLVNTVLCAGSVLLVTGSVLLLQDDNSIVQFIDVNNPNQVAYIGICLGSVTAFITFFGCAGSCAQNKKIIRLYLVMLVILFILFLTIIILGAIYRKSLRGNLGNGMKKTLNNIETNENKNENKNETVRLRKFWDDMQTEVQCCGLTGWEDWDFKPAIGVDTNSTITDGISQGVAIKTNSTEQVTNQLEYMSQEVLDRLPASCFSTGTHTEDQLYEDGCRDKAKEWLQTYITLILIASGGVAIVLVFSICISCWLLKSVKKALAYNF